MQPLGVSHRVLAGAAGAAGVHVHLLEADVALAHHLLKVALTNVPGNACKPAWKHYVTYIVMLHYTWNATCHLLIFHDLMTHDPWNIPHLWYW